MAMIIYISGVDEDGWFLYLECLRIKKLSKPGVRLPV